jgi:hypothetical protein
MNGWEKEKCKATAEAEQERPGRCQGTQDDTITVDRMGRRIVAACWLDSRLARFRGGCAPPHTLRR